jgi:hypothetical protein
VESDKGVCIMAKNKIRTIELVDEAPRPASGDGDVVVPVGNFNAILRWAGNKIVAVEAMNAADGLDIFDMQMKFPGGGGDDEVLGIVTCKKCAFDSDTGHTICWPVPC